MQTIVNLKSITIPVSPDVRAAMGHPSPAQMRRFYRQVIVEAIERAHKAALHIQRSTKELTVTE